MIEARDSNRDVPSRTGKGPRDLALEVLEPRLCTACGMCLGLCPYIEEMEENVAFISECKGDQGRCYAVCPRTRTDLGRLRTRYVPRPKVDYVLGPHDSVWMARSREERVRRKAQYGGAVTGLVMFGLEAGRIDAALLTGWSSDPEDTLLPRPLVARTREEVLSAAGSKYTASPSLKVLDRILAGGTKRLLVVGRPCQVLALRKRMDMDDPGFPAERVALVIGLFCMWSLAYREFKGMLGPVAQGQRPTRIDVPKGRFVIETEAGPIELPHDQVRSHARAACRTCYDFTSELADLSVGSTEWKDDWNTLIVRTEAGRAYLEAAREQGRIELEPFPPERLRLLREAALNKKQRVLEELEEQRRAKGTEPYLLLPEEEKAYILSKPDPLPAE